MRIAVRPSAVLIARQPSRSQPRSVSINRRTSFVGERSDSKRRRLERNSTCSLEKLNFTALSCLRIRPKCGRLLAPALCRDGPSTSNFLTCSLPAVNTVIAEERLLPWRLSALLTTPKRVILEVTTPGIGRTSSGRNGDESHRTLSLR